MQEGVANVFLKRLSHIIIFPVLIQAFKDWFQTLLHVPRFDEFWTPTQPWYVSSRANRYMQIVIYYWIVGQNFNQRLNFKDGVMKKFQKKNFYEGLQGWQEKATPMLKPGLNQV